MINTASKVQTVRMVDKNTSSLLIFKTLLCIASMAQWYETSLFLICAGGSWGAVSNPGGATSSSFSCSFFFLLLYFYPLACFRFSASRDFCGNVFLVIYRWPCIKEVRRAFNWSSKNFDGCSWSKNVSLVVLFSI